MNDRLPPPIPLRPDANAMREASVTSLARAVLTVARRSLDRNAPDATRAWPQDRTAALIVRAPVGPHNPTDAAALGTVATMFISSLVPISAAARVIDQSLKVTFGANALLSIPALTLPLAAWVADNAGIPVIQGTSSPGVLVRPHKLATSVTLTREMVDSANAEAVVRQVLSENVGATLDAALFSSEPEIIELSPPGLLYGIDPLPSSGDIIDDVALLAEALGPVSGAGQPVLVCAPGEAAALTLQTAREFMPVYASAALAPGTIIGLQPSALASAIEVPRVEGVRKRRCI